MNICVCIYVCMYEYMCMYVCVCMYVCMYVCVYMCVTLRSFCTSLRFSSSTILATYMVWHIKDTYVVCKYVEKTVFSVGF
jgi:hypothetical protein